MYFFIDRQFSVLRQLVKSGVSNADANARKCARYLFWILHRRPGLNGKAVMETLLANIDSSAQKSISSEISVPSQELRELLGGAASLLQVGGCDRENLAKLLSGLGLDAPGVVSTSRVPLTSREGRSPVKAARTPGKRFRSADSVRDPGLSSPVSAAPVQVPIQGGGKKSSPVLSARETSGPTRVPTAAKVVTAAEARRISMAMPQRVSQTRSSNSQGMLTLAGGMASDDKIGVKSAQTK